MTNDSTAIENAGDLAMSILYGLQALTCVFLWTQLRRRREQKRIRAYFFLLCCLAGVTRCLWFGLPDAVFAQGYEPENRRPRNFGSQVFLLNLLQYTIYSIPNLLYFIAYCLMICTWSSLVHLMFSSLRPGYQSTSSSSRPHGSRSSGDIKTTSIVVQPMSSSRSQTIAPGARKSRLIAWRTARRFFRFTAIVVCVLQLGLIGSMFLVDFFDVLCATCVFVSAMALFSLIGYSAYAVVTVQKLRPMYIRYFETSKQQQHQVGGEERNLNSDADASSAASRPHSSSIGSHSQSSPSASFTHVRASHRSQIDTEESYETHQIERNRGGFRGGNVGAESLISPIASHTIPSVAEAGTQQLVPTAAFHQSDNRSASNATRVSSSSSSTHRTHHSSRISQYARSSTSDDLSYEPTYGENDNDDDEEESGSGSDDEITAVAAKHLANALNGENETSRPPSQPSPPQVTDTTITVHILHDAAVLPASRATSAGALYTPVSSATDQQSASPLGREPSPAESAAYQRVPQPTFLQDPVAGERQLYPPSIGTTSDAENHLRPLTLMQPSPRSSPRQTGVYVSPSTAGAHGRSSARQSRSGSPLTIVESESSSLSDRSSVVPIFTRAASSGRPSSNASSSPSPHPSEDPERLIALYAWHRTRQIALLTLCVVLCSAARIISALIELHYADGSAGFPSFWWIIVDSYYLVFELCTSTIAMFILTQASGMSPGGGTRVTAGGISSAGVGINQPSIATIIPTSARGEHHSGRHRTNSEERMTRSNTNATSPRRMIPAMSTASTTTLGPYSSMHTIALHSKLLSVSYQPLPRINKQRFSSQPLLSSSVAIGNSAGSSAATGGGQSVSE